MQSFEDGKREILGRRSPESKVVEKLRIARRYFDVVSIDLLYDLPYGNTLLEDLKKAIDLDVDGISIYPLVYNKTMQQYLHPSPEKNEGEFLEAHDYLLEHGYSHISINHFSNGMDRFLYSEAFTRPEMPLLGVGPGAGGHVGNYEMFHIPGVRRYLKRPYEVVIFSMPEEVFCGYSVISQLFNGKTKLPVGEFASSVQTALKREWAELRGRELVLTPKGLFWANTLAYLMGLEFIRSHFLTTSPWAQKPEIH